jgi:hypothetical protein
MGAEMDSRIVKFSDRAIPNYEHTMFGRLIDHGAAIANMPDARQGTFSVKSISETVTFNQPALITVTVAGGSNTR